MPLSVQIFKHNLLTIVEDHHQSFLKDNGIFFNAAVTSWHKDFDVESLPDVDMLDFPPKPHVDKVTTAQEMIQVCAFNKFSLRGLLL